MKKGIFKKMNKKLLISGALLLFMCFSVFTMAIKTTLKELSKKGSMADNPTVSNLTSNSSTDVVTLLTGSNSNLRGETLEETVENYRKTYLMGVASDFCVYLKEDFTPKESDAEGRVAVGGDIKVDTPWGNVGNRNYTIGAGDYVTHVELDRLLPDRLGSATVIIGGKLYGQLNDTYYKDGKKYESGEYETEMPTEKSTKKIVLNYNELPDDYKPVYEDFNKYIPVNDGPGAWQKVDQRQTYVAKILDFDDSFSRLYEIGEELKESQEDNENQVTYDESNPNKKVIKFTYKGASTDKKDTVYFNLSSTDYEYFKEATIIEFENIPELPEPRVVMKNDGNTDVWNYAYIIVNVAGTGEFHLANPNSSGGSKATYINNECISVDMKNTNSDTSENNHPGTTSILYNFYDATKVVIGANFQGTILAPKAHVTDEQTEAKKMDENANVARGHLSGALIAKSFEGATEFGYRPFSGTIEIIPGNLKVSKTVVGDKNSQKEFKFKVILNGKLTGTYGDMVFKEGIAEFTLKDGESKTAKDLPSGITYTVEELDNEGYTVTTTNNTGTIPENEEIEAKFVNTLLTGSLKVSKTVSGTPLDINKTFNFKVVLSDTTISGIYGDMEFKDGVAEFTLKHTESKTATNLPVGITYTVTEEEDSQYEATSTGETGIIEEETKEATFVNTLLVGNLIVSKTVSGTPLDTDKEFKFRVELSDKTISGTYGDMDFNDGVAEFTLKHNESKKATNLPVGITYIVTEESDSQYKTTSTGDTGTIEKGKTSEAKFVNTLLVGNLKVSKTVSGTPLNSDKEFKFKVELSDETITGTYGEMTFSKGVAEFTLKHNENKTATDLPVGITYTVTEESDSQYKTTSTGDTGTIANNETKEATFINTLLTGNLEVSKIIDSEHIDLDKEFEFTVELSDKSITGTYGEMTFNEGVAEFTLKHNERKTATGLPINIGYTVSEKIEEEYEIHSSNSEGTISRDTTITSEFRNIQLVGDLIVSKLINGTHIDKEKEFEFTVELSDKTITGTYGEMTFNEGVAEFTLKHGESKKATDLPINIEYTVKEETEERYESEGENATGTIVEDETSVAKFTNTALVGNLEVSKKVEGKKIDSEKEFSFTVTLDEPLTGTYGDMVFKEGVAEFTLKHGESKKATDLPINIGYEVTEEKVEKYETQSKNETGKIVKDETQNVEFINTALVGNLEVTKKVVANKIDSEKEFMFTVTLDEELNGTYGDMEFKDGVSTFKLKHGESKKATDLPIDIGYEVTENAYERYKTESTNENGKIVRDETIEVEFVNTALVGNLEVTKKVEGKKSQNKFKFTVTLDENLNGTYGDMEFVDGVAEFELEDGESKTATDLPVGIGYTVTEENDSSYRSSSMNDIGNIVQDETIRVEFVNRFSAVAGDEAEIPNTYDGILLWIALGIISLVSIISVILFRRRICRQK